MSRQIFADIIRLTKFGVTYELDPAPEGGYVITVVDYPSCMTQGETIDEALANAEDALISCLSVDLESGLSIPETLEAWLERAAKGNGRKDTNTPTKRSHPRT